MFWKSGIAKKLMFKVVISKIKTIKLRLISNEKYQSYFLALTFENAI